MGNISLWTTSLGTRYESRSRAKPESPDTDARFAGAPLAGGRVDLSSVLSDYTDSGFVIAVLVRDPLSVRESRADHIGEQA